MRSNTGRDTSLELNIRRRLHAAGYRYRVDYAPIADVRRRADLVFTRIQLAVFVDGCFWHGCPAHYTAPKLNKDFWQAKVDGNRARDLDTDARLAAAGWAVLRYWEHQPVDEMFESITSTVRQLHLTRQ
jgi:DNA mismatch endonuclease (patch repair protein)